MAPMQGMQAVPTDVTVARAESKSTQAPDEEKVPSRSLFPCPTPPFSSSEPGPCRHKRRVRC